MTEPPVTPPFDLSALSAEMTAVFADAWREGRITPILPDGLSADGNTFTMTVRPTKSGPIES